MMIWHIYFCCKHFKVKVVGKSTSNNRYQRVCRRDGESERGKTFRASVYTIINARRRELMYVNVTSLYLSVYAVLECMFALIHTTRSHIYT